VCDRAVTRSVADTDRIAGVDRRAGPAHTAAARRRTGLDGICSFRPHGPPVPRTVHRTTLTERAPRHRWRERRHAASSSSCRTPVVVPPAGPRSSFLLPGPRSSFLLPDPGRRSSCRIPVVVWLDRDADAQRSMDGFAVTSRRSTRLSDRWIGSDDERWPPSPNDESAALSSVALASPISSPTAGDSTPDASRCETLLILQRTTRRERCAFLGSANGRRIASVRACVGSKASRSASPTRFTLNTIRAMIRPGK
jgi:hypothetical protein